MSRQQRHLGGVLMVVATPIGNLDDMSKRAIEVLHGADIIFAEDTRHSGHLLKHFGICTPMQSLHAHNEQSRFDQIDVRLAQGQCIALISDAGTPLISDPGYALIAHLRQAGRTIQVVPGPSALTAALSIAGLPTQHFYFEGFLPIKTKARQTRLAHLKAMMTTLVCYESPHRLLACLQDMIAIFGADHRVVVLKELTKCHEQTWYGSLSEVHQTLQKGPDTQRKGEWVMVIDRYILPKVGQYDHYIPIIEALLQHHSPRTVHQLMQHAFDLPKSWLYSCIQSHKPKSSEV